MATFGPDRISQLDVRQINNFLKLCIAVVDFKGKGLFRFPGDEEQVADCLENILPILKNLDLEISDLKTDEPESTSASSAPAASSTLTYSERNKAFQLNELRMELAKLRAGPKASTVDISLIDTAKKIISGTPTLLHSEPGHAIQQQIKALFRHYQSWLQYQDVKFDDEKRSPITIIKPEYIQQTRKLQVGIVKELIAEKRVDLAELFHNLFHMCYLSNEGNELNQSFILGKLMGQCALINPFRMQDQLPDIPPKQLATYAAGFFEVAITCGHFKQTFAQAELEYQAGLESPVLETTQERWVSSSKADKKLKSRASSGWLRRFSTKSTSQDRMEVASTAAPELDAVSKGPESNLSLLFSQLELDGGAPDLEDVQVMGSSGASSAPSTPRVSVTPSYHSGQTRKLSVDGNYSRAIQAVAASSSEEDPSTPTTSTASTFTTQPTQQRSGELAIEKTSQDGVTTYKNPLYNQTIVPRTRKG